MPLHGDAREPLQELSQVLEHYMLRSEQLDTRLMLASDGEQAAGMLLQRLPDGPEREALFLEAKKIANELRNWVGKEIGPIAKPKDIRFGENLPKTRSGKIMRRVLKARAQ